MRNETRGRDLAFERSAAGLIQSRVAREVGITMQLLIDLERERVKDPELIERVKAVIERLAAEKAEAQA